MVHGISVKCLGNILSGHPYIKKVFHVDPTGADKCEIEIFCSENFIFCIFPYKTQNPKTQSKTFFDRPIVGHCDCFDPRSQTHMKHICS